MQISKRGSALAAAVALFLAGSAGCNRTGSTSSNDTGSSSQNSSDAVATVNGAPITQSDFYTALQGYLPNPQNPMSTGQTAGRAVLQQLIQNQLVEGLAKQQGVAPTDAEVDAQYSGVKMVQEVNLVKPFEDALADLGYTPDQFKDLQIRPQVAQFKLVTKGLTATDAEILAYYNAHKTDQFTKPNRAHIKRIALASQSDAQMIYNQIKQGKAFETFTAKSIDNQFPDGEVPQWVNLDDTRNTSLNPMIKIIKATPPPNTTPPFPFQGGWWLVKVMEVKQKEVWPLEQVKSLITYRLLSQKAQQNPTAITTFQQNLRDYQTKAKYDIPEKQYASLLIQLQSPPPPPSFINAPPPAAAPGQAPKIKITPAPATGAKP